MSTSFNPQTPSDSDSVYDAYFAFRQNMIAIHNLLNVDHFNGSNPNFHGNHRLVNLPTPQDTDPTPTGDIGVLYTKKEEGKTKLKFANADANWIIALGEQTGTTPNPDPQPPTPQPDTQFQGPSFMDPSAQGAGASSGSGTGYARFANKFCILWARSWVPKKSGGTVNEVLVNYPDNLRFSRVFSAHFGYGQDQNVINQMYERTSKRVLPPGYTVGTSGVYLQNNNETHSIFMWVTIIGELQN